MVASNTASFEPMRLTHFIDGGINKNARLLVLFYVVVYHIATPAFVALETLNFDALFVTRFVAHALMHFVLIVPILFFRDVGYLHPLVFPKLYAIAFDVAFQPLHILFPFILSAAPWFEFSPSWSIILSNLSASEYVAYHSYYNLTTVIFWVSLYFGFYLLKTRPKADVPKPTTDYSNIPYAAAIYLIGAILAGWAFIMSRGGITSQILSFYQGRFETMSGLGVFTVVTKVGSVAVLIWLASSRRAGTNPVFIFLFLALLPVYWLVDGSRSSMLLLIMTMLMVVMMKTGRIQYTNGAIVAAFALIAFGLLGMLRHDYNATSVNYDVFDANNFSSWLEASQNETKKRASEEGDLAAFVAANEVGFLNGKSYLSVIAYPIPRAIWPEKPKNIFTYNNWVAFMGNSPEDAAPKVWGIPTNSVSEAYWNFGVVGIIIVPILIGMGLRWVFNLLKSNPYAPWACVLYIEFLLYFNGGSRWALYLIQNLVGLGLIMMIKIVLEQSRVLKPRTVITTN